jgi:hypothetical protein
MALIAMLVSAAVAATLGVPVVILLALAGPVVLAVLVLAAQGG